jgi:hypothetical protein
MRGGQYNLSDMPLACRSAWEGRSHHESTSRRDACAPSDKLKSLWQKSVSFFTPEECDAYSKLRL